MTTTPRPWTLLPKHLLSQQSGLRFLEPISSIACYTKHGRDDEWKVVAENVSNEDAALILEAVNAYDVLQVENAKLRAALEKLFIAIDDSHPEDLPAEIFAAAMQAQAAMDAGKETP